MLYLEIKKKFLGCEQRNAKWGLRPEIRDKSWPVLLHIKVGKEDNRRVGGQENQNVPE